MRKTAFLKQIVKRQKKYHSGRTGICSGCPGRCGSLQLLPGDLSQQAEELAEKVSFSEVTGFG